MSSFAGARSRFSSCPIFNDQAAYAGDGLPPRRAQQDGNRACSMRTADLLRLVLQHSLSSTPPRASRKMNVADEEWSFSHAEQMPPRRRSRKQQATRVPARPQRGGAAPLLPAPGRITEDDLPPWWYAIAVTSERSTIPLLDLDARTSDQLSSGGSKDERLGARSGRPRRLGGGSGFNSGTEPQAYLRARAATGLHRLREAPLSGPRTQRRHSRRHPLPPSTTASR